VATREPTIVEINQTIGNFHVDVDVNDPDWMGALQYNYRGPVLAVSVYF